MYRVINMKSIDLIFLIKQRREIKYWLNAYGDLVAVWQGRDGKERAVGLNERGETIVFLTNRPWR